MKPLIGITTGEIHNLTSPWSPVTYGQSRTYSDAIIQAGGVPILVPITDDFEVLARLYESVDGLLFAGGNDVDPALYGETSSKYTKDISPRRDALELQLLSWATRDKKPFLAICRGMQLWNVFAGGSLYQDIPTELTDASDHDISTKHKSLEDIAHILRLDSSSKLAGIIGSKTIGANTHHHQAIKKLGEGMNAIAWAEDGIVEAIEGQDAHFAIGIQSHPESLLNKEMKWQSVFEALIQASSENR